MVNYIILDLELPSNFMDNQQLLIKGQNYDVYIENTTYDHDMMIVTISNIIKKF
jgi:hypothetical protein